MDACLAQTPSVDPDYGPLPVFLAGFGSAPGDGDEGDFGSGGVACRSEAMQDF